MVGMGMIRETYRPFFETVRQVPLSTRFRSLEVVPRPSPAALRTSRSLPRKPATARGRPSLRARLIGQLLKADGGVDFVCVATPDDDT